MAITYPTALDSLTNPVSSDPLSSPSHSGQNSDANEVLEALEAMVGVNSSAVTTSHDYKLSGVTGNDKAASLTGTETLTNERLTSPEVNEAVEVTATRVARAMVLTPRTKDGMIQKTGSSQVGGTTGIKSRYRANAKIKKIAITKLGTETPIGAKKRLM